MAHQEHHRHDRAGWLRASVLGANDGLISTSSLIIGVASANSAHETILVAGVAGLVAGAISMAAGEYVSVCTQSDIERSDLSIESKALKENYEEEVTELAEIYQKRGVDKSLSFDVTRQMMDKDALGTHARDEIGITEGSEAQPLMAAFSSALSFSVGAILPLFTAIFITNESLVFTVATFTLVFLALLGALSAYLSGAKIVKGVLRVTFWGAIAMASTALIGEIIGTAV
jgi:VIT1/CCC1 family predicted Fe2+/Mn2+ transporter